MRIFMWCLVVQVSWFQTVLAVVRMRRTTTPATRSSKCEDQTLNGISCQTQLIRFGFYLCYSMEDRCCQTCRRLKYFGRKGCEYGDHTSVCTKKMCHIHSNLKPCCNTCRDEILRDYINKTGGMDVVMETPTDARVAASPSTPLPSMTSSVSTVCGFLGATLLAWTGVISWLIRGCV